MQKYKILKPNVDFEFEDNLSINVKGTRTKRIVVDKKTHDTAYFKYEKYNCSEACSEKMSYEIANVLDYECAHIELAKDEYGNIGILNYLFIDRNTNVHYDAISYINKKSFDRKYFYTIKNIEKCLNEISLNLFDDFLKIMIFDALIGETDRHEENWGIIKNAEGYKISPLYDNGCNLLRDFKNEEFAKKYYDGSKKFISYIKKSKSLIYKEDHKGKYNLIELIEYLYKEYPVQIEKEILNLNKLNDENIEKIVWKIPDELLTNIHKEHIIFFLKTRRDLLKSIIE